jgi:hypothetical protein
MPLPAPATASPSASDQAGAVKPNGSSKQVQSVITLI